MATFTVTNLNDSGAGSLRAAIAAANSETPGMASTISFSVGGTITLASDLPAVTNPTTIAAASTTIGAAPTVGIDFNGHAGLVFAAGSDGSELIGLSLGNATGNGVTLNANSIVLNNNYIGLALDGTALGNTGDGVFVSASSANNQIGSNPDATSDVVANVISSNGGNGISFHGSADNVVVSNRIGTSIDGMSAMANSGNGIWVTDASNGNTIGGTAFTDSNTGDQNDPTGNKGSTTPVFVVPPLGNLISGNGGDGVLINANSQNNVLYGNFIGTTPDGDAALGNVGDGVAIVDADKNSLIGCDFVQNPFVYYNVIGGNGGNGLRVTDSDDITVHANFIGLGANNATSVGNAGDGILINGSSQNTTVGGVIPLGNVISGNTLNGIEVADTASGFTTFNTFAGVAAFAGIAPNGNDGLLITSTGGNQTVRTNVFSANGNNGLEIAGDAWGVTVVPNIMGLNTRGDEAGIFGNFNDGILITGHAHDNTIGGTGRDQLSVIRQNTLSGNGNYGIEINGNAYNNVVADSAIGTDIQELAALPNANGGILLAGTGHGNVVGTAIVGTSPAPSPAALLNIISGNGGNGVTIAAGVTGDAVINNWIGLNIAGQATLPNAGLPIQNLGGYNVIYGNAATGSLPVQSPTLQLEALYVGWFGRAAAAPEFQANMQTVLTDILGGSSLTQAMLDISESFATSPEDAPYAELASLTQPVTDPTPEQIALTNSFIDQTYNNLFGRPADASEKTTWREAFFNGDVSFSSLVYDIAQIAGGTDVTAENSKFDAAAYFTTATGEAHHVPSPGEMQAAVSGVVDQTTELASQAATDALVSATHSQITYQSILSPGDIITGVRADLNGAVILTGSHETGSGTSTQAFLYEGPLNNTEAGTMYLLTPSFGPSETIKTASFYGPDTSIFDPALGLGNVRAVGSYQYDESPSGVVNHGMLYQGPINGSGGTWTQIDVPSDGTNVVGGIVIGGTVEDTILHSTQGDLVVGNYDLAGPGGTFLGANGFIYNIETQQYTLMQINGSLDNLTTLYGIWQNGIGSTSYTITGGTRDDHGLNVGFLEDYDSSTGIFSNLTYYSGFNHPGVITHFENITAVPGGFDLVATTDSGPAFAFIAVNADGSFGSATWVGVDLPGSDLLTGNIAYQNTIGGIYNTSSSDGVASYLGTVDLSHVNSAGGLIMPVGSHEFAYALSVNASLGDTINGSTSAGNVLGGSIGNDTIIGTLSTTAPDTIFTGGGADTITLATSHTAADRIELYAGNSLNNAAALVPGGVVASVSGSIVDASDIPQLGWWGQATAQFGGPVSDASTNAGDGTGTSKDISTVANFSTDSDTIDISLGAFSGLLRNLGAGSGPRLGTAIFSNPVDPGGTVTVANADVLLIHSTSGFADAAAVAAALLSDPITFAGSQTGQFNHYIIAYEDQTGDVRIADMDIHLGSATSFTTTDGGATLSISDMVELTSVSLVSLQEGNITFLAGGGRDVVSGETLIVSSGQTSSGLIVLDGGELNVVGGGTVIHSLILSGGEEIVGSGGIDSGATVDGGGVQVLGPDAIAGGVTVNSDGVQILSSGAVASGTVVSSGGVEVLFSGGAATATTVRSGGFLELAGGTATSANLDPGATVQVDPGTTVSGFSVGSGVTLQVVLSAAVAGTTVSSGGILELQGGASATSTTLLAGATLEIISGYSLSGFGVARAVTLEVATGATATGTTVSSGAVELVSGGTVSGTNVQGGGTVLVRSGGHTSGDVLIGSGSTLVASETVFAGGVASGTVLSNTGLLTVSSGGVATGTLVGSGGGLVVFAGGSAIGAILSNGGIETLSGGTAIGTQVKSGAAVSATVGINSAAVISNGGKVLLTGGADLGVTVLNGGQEIVSSGGAASGTILSSGGMQVLSSGGQASGTQVMSGGVVNVVGGTDTGATISGGGQAVVSGGADIGVTVLSGGVELVLAGGTTSASILSNGGTETVSSGGVTTGTVIHSGGRESVLASGTASGTVVSSGGLEVLSAGAALGTVLSAGGQEIVSSGGRATGTVISGGGGELVSSGGVANGAVVLTGGLQMALKGGVISGTTVSIGGQELVSSGGVARGVVLSAGGAEIVFNGGTASGTTILSRGGEFVSSGGLATSVTILGGIQVVSGHGLASGTIISSGGIEYVSAGTTVATVVSSGGQEVVSSGGTAIGTVIGSSGTELVMSGGAISGATISGGTLEIQSGGGVMSSTITFSGGGTLMLDDTKFRGKIAGFAEPDTIDLTTVSFASATLGYTGNTLSGTLTVTDGTHTAKLAMLGQYVVGNFTLSDDGHGGTLVSDPPVDSGGHLAPSGH